MDYINLPKEVFQPIANGDKTMFLYFPAIETTLNSALWILRLEKRLTLLYRKKNSVGLTEIGLAYDIFQLMEIGYKNKPEDVMPLIIQTTGIKAIRLKDITDGDCIRMGIRANFRPQSMTTKFYLPNNPENGYTTPQMAFSLYIDKTFGIGTWRKNPVVILYEFEL